MKGKGEKKKVRERCRKKKNGRKGEKKSKKDLSYCSRVLNPGLRYERQNQLPLRQRN